MSSRTVPIVVAIVAIGGAVWWWQRRSSEPSAGAHSTASTADPQPNPSPAPIVRIKPVLPDPPTPSLPTADQQFAAEPVDPTWAGATQVALADRLKTVPNVVATECRSTQCRVVLIGTLHDLGTSIERLESDGPLHSYARNILLTAPQHRDDGTVELHAFARFERAANAD